MIASKSRWQSLCARLGVEQELAETWQALYDAYNEDGRFYHTWMHLEDCLSQFDSCRQLTPNADEVEFALWFHDAIYDPRAADNERQSADWACRLLKANNASTACIEQVDTLIMATCHDATPEAEAEQYLVDVDLSILGREPAAFEHYEAQVRQEYRWVPDTDFRQGRCRILDAFLQRPRIYQTDTFFTRYEASARRNLASSIQTLSQSPKPAV